MPQPLIRPGLTVKPVGVHDRLLPERVADIDDLQQRSRDDPPGGARACAVDALDIVDPKPAPVRVDRRGIGSDDRHDVVRRRHLSPPAPTPSVTSSLSPRSQRGDMVALELRFPQMCPAPLTKNHISGRRIGCRSTARGTLRTRLRGWMLSC